MALKSFEDIKLRDRTKSDYLAEHGIPQLIIPYWEFDNIGKIVNDFINELSTSHTLF